MLEQICAGMIAITRMKMIHCDLATRNILVFAFDASNPAGTRVKITDFGLSVDRLYQTHAYGAQNEDVPFRWMPPEAFRSRRFMNMNLRLLSDVARRLGLRSDCVGAAHGWRGALWLHRLHWYVI